MKKIDITDRLNFEENNCLIIKGKEIEVNSDAPSMLKVLQFMSGDAGAKEVNEAYETLFPVASREKLAKLKLSFDDLIVVIKAAVELITGEKQEKE
ncbi:hypothetical protein [Oribacterium sinus]|jgi:hypothetical protein|nr:MAG TPA: hypothetical protein [Caudoviricetes sp.]